MNCKSCKDTGLLKAWNKFYDSGFTQYCFRCHCAKGFSHLESNVSQWNEGHKLSFKISYDQGDSPHLRSETKKTSIEEDKDKIIRLMKDKRFDSKEFKELLDRHGKPALVGIYEASFRQEST